MKEPLISVVVPVYNAAAFLERTVASIQEQTYQNLDILLVDDGSRDESFALCQALSEKDARIRCFTQANGGAAAARNHGMREARGAYIGFVDSDDRIAPDMYETLLSGARDLEAQGYRRFLVQTGRREVDEAGNALPDAVVPPAQETRISSMEFARSLLLYTGDASFCTALLPAAYMQAHPFPEGVMGEDFRLLMEMANASLEAVLRLPQRGYEVVHRKGSATRRAAPSQFSHVYIDIVNHADYVERKMVPHHPELAVPAQRFGLYERLDYLLHVPIPDMNEKNLFYQSVLVYLRKNFHAMWRNPYLTRKNKAYLTLLTMAPRKTRQIHWALRKRAIMKDISEGLGKEGKQR